MSCPQFGGGRYLSEPNVTWKDFLRSDLNLDQHRKQPRTVFYLQGPGNYWPIIKEPVTYYLGSTYFLYTTDRSPYYFTKSLPRTSRTWRINNFHDSTVFEIVKLGRISWRLGIPVGKEERRLPRKVEHESFCTRSGILTILWYSRTRIRRVE